MTPNFQGEFGVNASGTSALLVRLDYRVGAHNWRHSANPDTVRGIVDYFNDDMDVEAAFLSSLNYNFVPGTVLVDVFAALTSDLLNTFSSTNNFLLYKAFQGQWNTSLVLARDTFMNDAMLSVLREANDKAYITAFVLS